MKKLLIIEDDVDTLNALKKFFERKKYNVEIGTNAEQVSEVVKKFTPDIIISDWMLQDSTNGVAIVKQLHTQFTHIEVIFITGHDIEKLQSETENINVHKYIRKPFEFATIEAAVNSASN